MIGGYFRLDGARRRPFVFARLSIPSQRIAGEVHFLVDTGADGTLLAPADAAFLRLDLARLPTGPQSTGVGGVTATALAPASLALDGRTFDISLRILKPGPRRQQAALARIPSLLGRDLLAHFALLLEERTERVLLLDPAEADALGLP